jgi:hypothetical protein
VREAVVTLDVQHAQKRAALKPAELLQPLLGLRPQRHRHYSSLNLTLKLLKNCYGSPGESTTKDTKSTKQEKGGGGTGEGR